MIVELGHFALILAFATSLVQATLPIIGSRRRDSSLMELAPICAIIAFGLVAFSYLVLTNAYIQSDFSVFNVWQNSHSMMPLIFKITGVWGNHEGSMMLWVLILVFFGAMVAAFGNDLPQTLKANTLAVQAWISVAFLAFILLTSNPFVRLIPVPAEGRELNPILQDYGLAIHPPLLYLGYVGFSITFAFAVAALIEGRVDAAWARWVRPWALAAWTFLTAGICMGSYWSYYELGWGGWWLWDPVENAAFMPWLAGTALLHSALVVEKREAMKIWTVLLAIFTFSLSLLGTFLVRSGVLASVHAFASDPTRGIFILGILTIFIGGAFALFAWRAPTLTADGLFAPLSREGALIFNNLILVTAAATVLLGTLYPLLLQTLTGSKITVGPPFFNLTFTPMIVILLLAVPFGPILGWKRADLIAAAQRLYFAAVIGFAAALVIILAVTGAPVLAALGIGLAFYVMVGASAEFFVRSGLGKTDIATVWRRIKGIPRSVLGTMCAHFGVGVSLLGIVVATAFSTEAIFEMKPGDVQKVGCCQIRFDGTHAARGPNYLADVGRFSVIKNGHMAANVDAEKRVYDSSKVSTTEAGIQTFGLSQLYISLGEVHSNQHAIVRLWWKSYITLIWIGAMIMAFGGALSLFDRRLRFGIPTARRRKIVQQLSFERSE
jgi:cytochrome c-type biogenesis protein CcmF